MQRQILNYSYNSTINHSHLGRTMYMVSEIHDWKWLHHEIKTVAVLIQTAYDICHIQFLA